MGKSILISLLNYLKSILAVILVLAYMFLSSGDFSFMLTLAASI